MQYDFFVDLILAVVFIVAITGCGAVCKSAINICGRREEENFPGPFELK